MPVDATARTYLDFAGLGQLKSEASQNNGKAVRATAEQFEAYFLQNIMKTMREATLKSDLLESDAMDTYQDMMDKEVALHMARRGSVGMADMLEKQMHQLAAQQPAQPLSTQDALASREASQGLPLNPVRAAVPLTSGSNSGYDLPQRVYRLDGVPDPRPQGDDA